MRALRKFIAHANFTVLHVLLFLLSSAVYTVCRLLLPYIFVGRIADVVSIIIAGVTFFGLVSWIDKIWKEENNQ